MMLNRTELRLRPSGMTRSWRTMPSWCAPSLRIHLAGVLEHNDVGLDRAGIAAVEGFLEVAVDGGRGGHNGDGQVPQFTVPRSIDQYIGITQLQRGRQIR